MSYSIDFCRHVFKITKKKERDSLTFRQTGERFGVPIRTLFKWKNCIEPKFHRNKPATGIDTEALKKHVKDYPDSYQRERAAYFGVSPKKSLIFFWRTCFLGKKYFWEKNTIILVKQFFGDYFLHFFSVVLRVK